MRTLYGQLTGDPSSANMTLGTTLLSDSVRAACSLRPFAFLETTEDADTVASQQSYPIPNGIGDRLSDLYVTVGTTVHSPVPVVTAERWKEVLAANLGVSDVPQYWYREGGNALLAPTPATSGNTITFRGRKRAVDLGAADYSTGTVVSVANGGKAVVGSGTSWTSPMAGRFIRITATDAANEGDGQWYEIASVADATNLTLVRPYEGTAIAAGAAAYAIGQMSPVPEEYDIAPVYRSVAVYFSMEDSAKADRFWRMYDGGVEAGLSREYGGVIGRMLEGTPKDERRYVPPSADGLRDPNWPETDQITGI